MSERSRLLLDVNALLALGWPNHQFHERTVRRLERKPVSRWATCALTQLGFVRLSSNASVVGVTKTPGEAVDVLRELTADRHHDFLEELPAVTALTDFFDRLLGHQQVTDAYLLGLAHARGAKLLTLDRRLAALAPKGAVIEALGE